MKKKVLFNLIIFTIMVLFFVTTSYGFGLNDIKGTQTEVNTIKNAGNSIMRVVSTIGVVISVAMLVALGIKYMLGSTEEKANYKKSLLPYIIGASLVFAASSIAQLVYNLANQL
jgi:type IV secretory pathway VirB2 component (pilin)